MKFCSEDEKKKQIFIIKFVLIKSKFIFRTFFLKYENSDGKLFIFKNTLIQI